MLSLWWQEGPNMSGSGNEDSGQEEDTAYDRGYRGQRK